MTVVHPIEAESYRILAARVDLSAWPEPARAVVARVIHASADLEYASTMAIGDGAVAAGIAALERGAPVIADVEMTARGITVVEAHSWLGATTAREHGHEGMTRSAAAITAAAHAHPDGAVFVVGCAPTALDALCDLVDAGAVRPALVIGMPVGFVGAAEAKARLRATAVTSISNHGEKGGSAVASAAVNAIGRLVHG
jgi:precorrin-8X/cobalt-precorrin-8 methylmutase